MHVLVLCCMCVCANLLSKITEKHGVWHFVEIIALKRKLYISTYGFRQSYTNLKRQALYYVKKKSLYQLVIHYQKIV